MRGAPFMGSAPALAGDLTLLFRIHCGKSTLVVVVLIAPAS